MLLDVEDVIGLDFVETWLYRSQFGGHQSTIVEKFIGARKTMWLMSFM